MQTTWKIEVDLAVRRPPAVHGTVTVLLDWDADDDNGAVLEAIQMASESGHPIAMAVGSRVVAWDC